jgi:hypothetical protein
MLCNDEPILGEVRLAGFRRISHGLYLRERPHLSNDEEFRRDLRAWLCVLPAGAVFTHVTAARLRGWRLPPLPEQLPVFAAVHGQVNRVARPGLLCSRLVAIPEEGAQPTQAVEGLPVDAPEEILLRCARDLGHLDLVVILDSAMALRDIDRTMMERLLESRRPGVRALRRAYEAADERAESGGETVLRSFHIAMEIAVESQVDLHDAGGRFVGRADLRVRGTRHVHEYDGAGHRDQDRQRSDLRRERRFAETTYVRRGYTLDELLNHPAVVMHEMDVALGRAHQLERLRRWRRMVDGSMYSEAGRARVMNRWRRQMGVVDWR